MAGQSYGVGTIWGHDSSHFNDFPVPLDCVDYPTAFNRSETYCPWIFDDEINGFPHTVEDICPAFDVNDSYTEWKLDSDIFEGFPISKAINDIARMGAFIDNENLTSVKIPITTTHVGPYSFYNTGLTTAKIPPDCYKYPYSFPDDCTVSYYNSALNAYPNLIELNLYDTEAQVREKIALNLTVYEGPIGNLGDSVIRSIPYTVDAINTSTITSGVPRNSWLRCKDWWTRANTTGGAMFSYLVSYPHYSGYTIIDYIEATGYQYVIIDEVAGLIESGSKQIIDIEFTDTSSSQSMGYFDTGGAYWGVRNQNGQFVLDADWYYTWNPTYNISATGRIKVVSRIEYNTANTVGKEGVSDYETGYNLGDWERAKEGYILFAVKNTAYDFIRRCAAKLYGVEFYHLSDDSLWTKLYPVLRDTDNAIGLYSVASGTFYPSNFNRFIYKGCTPVQSVTTDGAGAYFEIPEITGGAKLVIDCNFINQNRQQFSGFYGNTGCYFGCDENGILIADSDSSWHPRYNIDATVRRLYEVVIQEGQTNKVGIYDSVQIEEGYGCFQDLSNLPFTIGKLPPTSDYNCDLTIYSAKFYDLTTNALLLDLRPCLRVSDTAIGLFDLLTGTFYGNAGIGTFSYVY